MTLPQHDIIIRSMAGAGELDLFCALDYVLNDELADDLAAGRRRPAWMWVALRGGRLVGRAAWWGSDGEAAPYLLDILDVADDPDRIEVGVRLLTAALSEVIPAGTCPPEYSRFIPPDWREHASTQRAVEDRMAMAVRTGAQLLTERFRFEWRPGTPIAAPTGRIEFRPASDDGELLDLMTLAMDGTIDAHSRQDLAVMSARQGAERHFEEEPAGFVIPARNNYHAIVAYLGVLPAHRGKGYVSEILAEGARILAAQDVPRIRASTDPGNTPMAEAFSRAGWVNFERSISMTWP